MAHGRKLRYAAMSHSVIPLVLLYHIFHLLNQFLAGVSGVHKGREVFHNPGLRVWTFHNIIYGLFLSVIILFCDAGRVCFACSGFGFGYGVCFQIPFVHQDCQNFGDGVSF